MFKIFSKNKKISELKSIIIQKDEEIEKLKRDKRDSIDDLLYEYGRKIKLIQNDKRDLEDEISALKTKKTELEDLKSRNLLKEIRQLEDKLHRASSDSINIELEKARSRIEVLQSEVELKDKLVKSLSELPDVKKMIDNVASLRVPAIDEMKEIFKLFDSNSSKDLMKQIEELNNKLNIQYKNNGYGIIDQHYNNNRY